MSQLVHNISQYLAKESSLGGDTHQNAEILAYGIKILFLHITALGGIIILAWLMDTLHTTLLLWAAAFSLRIFVGSYHQSGPLKCWILTVTLFSSLSYLVTVLAPRVTDYMYIAHFIGLLFVIYCILSYAPVTITSKQFSPAKQRKLRNTALVVLFLWTTLIFAPHTLLNISPVNSLAITLGLVVQGISIIPFKAKL